MVRVVVMQASGSKTTGCVLVGGERVCGTGHLSLIPPGSISIGLLRHHLFRSPANGIIHLWVPVITSGRVDSSQPSSGPTLLQKEDGLVMVHLLGCRGELHEGSKTWLCKIGEREKILLHGQVEGVPVGEVKISK